MASTVAISESELMEYEGPPLLPGRTSENEAQDPHRVDNAIRKFQDVLQLSPNTFTRKQEAIFSLALKEALYEVLDVPGEQRDLRKELVRIKKHDFWK